MELDISNATEEVRKEIKERGSREFRDVLQVSLRQVHHHVSFLRQRNQWARARVPQLQAHRRRRRRWRRRRRRRIQTYRSRGEGRGGWGIGRRRFVVLGGVEIDEARHGIRNKNPSFSSKPAVVVAEIPERNVEAASSASALYKDEEEEEEFD